MDGHRRDGLSGGTFAALAVRRGLLRLAGMLAVVALLVGVLAVGAAAVLWMAGWPSAVTATCTDQAGSVPIDPSGPAAADDEQRRNAAVIVATGRRLQVPDRGLWVALATALQESGLRNLDYGDRDSLGLFQQRPSQGWGSPAQILTPDYAATQFFTRLVTIPGWTTMPLWQAAQSVQRSAFPLAYARWEQDAADLLAGVDRATAGGPVRPCVPAGAVAGLPDAPPGCVADDPTTNGCVTAVTRSALMQAESAFGGLRKGRMIRSAGCFAPRPANPTSDHPLGKGCDLFPGMAGRFATGVDLENGWRAAGWFRSNAATLQVSYVIWQGRIWTPGRPDSGGWGQEYTGGGVYDPSDPVGGHYDHLHVSFLR
ncbi:MULTISPECIES: hypothetical protein [unclassified Pseudonocardia]|uniref:hypothetical protein n=1 Tax=unclassified Pseudonocardia TaxID=2619320 RepID=UPI00095C9C1B|nr:MULTISPECIES: hypothetical protein [unclassified Pseudonocardia]MBN9098019.1 hypothetical protein [Pseudonocardia sp.]OJY54420.1 MAG: hypothetical protein BGP03_23065 [Pseudonocardia sp. 73-21]